MQSTGEALGAQESIPCGDILAKSVGMRPRFSCPTPGIPDPDIVRSLESAESTESFDTILSQYEQTHSRRSGEGGKQISGTVVAVTADSVIVDIGYKTEGVLPLAVFQAAGESVEPGAKLLVSVKGRNEEGYYELSRMRVEQPKDWSALEKAFEDKAVIVGTVTGVVKGGLTVDVGVRAFMPGSRSGARDAAEMEKLVGQEIRCRIIKLDAAEEDVVVDRRAVAEEEDRSTKERRYAEIQEGDVGFGYGAEPYGLWGVCRYRWSGWVAAYQRYCVEPGGEAGGCVDGGAAD